MKDGKEPAAGKQEQDSQIKISDSVIVIEKEIKNDQIHKDLITGVQNLNELEFLTCGVEQALKLWDKSLQQCDYTIETHNPLYTMAITGEKGDIMIASLGQGDLIVFGLANKNQLDIVEGAHHETVIQIVSLQKLKNKYFATRCLAGNVNIWSSTQHPDRLFTMERVDKDDQSYAHEGTFNQTKMQDQITDPNLTTSQMMTGPIASDRDKMIELKYKLQNQQSSTVLCFSNYNESKIYLAIVDLKTRRKNIIKTFNNQRRPTCLYQIDEQNLLVGTEGGCIEHWSIETEQLITTYDAHTKSEEGVSSIIELKTQSYLLWGDYQSKSDRAKLIATASLGTSEYRIWVLFTDSPVTLQTHIKIETSLPGIRYLLESSDNQIVAIDTQKTLKFYEFVDKVKKEEEERQAKEEEDLHQGIREMFEKYDEDKSGRISFDEFSNFLNDYFNSKGWAWGIPEWQFRSIFDNFDLNKSGQISKFEMKPLVKVLIGEGYLKIK